MSEFKEIEPGFEYASFDYTEGLPEELKAKTSINLAQKDILTFKEDNGARKTITHFILDEYYYVVIAMTHNNTGVWVTHNDVFRYQLNI